MTEQAPEPTPKPTFEQSTDSVGREVGGASERFDRQAEEARRRA